ncbi:CheR family methyltransferase [Desulfuromonas thiophila]|uniref:protein-glutamate O-methyltransferase n=1 Tax=Desulfuromonas thiophila TaxID=57664 RepID=A0A1G7CWD3_9BACT|nr:CheR family methyltransferase [Desulfuromonas thiophila]SDE43553.1 two-component system, chemotaxis family, CheB/CheR fusion protein [Desulfuromonas thiophila]
MTSPSPAELDPYWIGIGASAGGLDALKELLAELNDANDAIYIIAQHLDPKHPTILQDLLSRITHLPITLVEQDTVPRPGNIYLIAPGHNASVRDQSICLTPAAVVGPKPSITDLFTSMASDVAEKAIGVILSGTGSDGAQGMIAIKAAGGITLAQDETSAKYSGMPRAARETGFVDLVLSPRDIAREIRQFIRLNGKHRETLSTPKMRSNLEKIFQRLLDQTGYDFSGYKLKTVQRRIQRRMAVHKLITLDDYVTLLMASSTEVEELFKDMLISVTAFFRDPDAFAALAEIIDEMVDRCEAHGSLRVWVPGCANGEEAYSICILLQQAAARTRKELNLQLFATDIDEHALSLARRGIYSTNQIKDVDSEILKHYFQEKDGQYHISKRIRDQVVFARQNLIMDPPFSHLDLISCRNVLIYFNLETQQKILQTFHFALKPQSHLFLGKSESASNIAAELFEQRDKHCQIFRRRTIAASQRADHISSANRLMQSLNSTEPALLADESEPSLELLLEQLLLDKMVPAALVVDSQGHILHIRGQVSDYLTFPQGRIDTSVFNLARDDLKIDVRSLLQRAKREGRAASQALFYQRPERPCSLFLRVQQLDSSQHDDLFVLAFIDVDLDSQVQRLAGSLAGDSAALSHEQLTQEVAMFRDRLQSSIQDLETTNEELQSTNEELQSANEELQSANEELQTANEELQSTNEEISTVNQELEIKSFELEQVNNDLEKMLLSVDAAILFLDNRLRLQRYTRKAAELFGLGPEDLRQTVTSMGYAVDIPHLRQELLAVIEQESETCLPLQLESTPLQLRLVPYKADGDPVVGVMMFFEPPGKTMEGACICADPGSWLQIFNQHCPHALVSCDSQGLIRFVNDSFCQMFAYERPDLLGQNIDRLMPEPYRSQHDTYLKAFLRGESQGNVIGQWRTVTALHRDNRRFMVAVCVYPLESAIRQAGFIALFNPATVSFHA